METLHDAPDEVGVTEKLISRHVVAERLDCDPSTLSRMVKEGRFIPPATMVGHMMRWRERDVNAWIAERAAAAKKIAATAKKDVELQKRSRRA